MFMLLIGFDGCPEFLINVGNDIEQINDMVLQKAIELGATKEDLSARDSSGCRITGVGVLWVVEEKKP